jgi:hypothetical protein
MGGRRGDSAAFSVSAALIEGRGGQFTTAPAIGPVSLIS